MNNKPLKLAQDLLCICTAYAGEANNEQELNKKKKAEKVLAHPG
ncbi:hypothetical protein NRY95_21880 [Xanthomonas campestris pv. phormiicola]|nr:hypothetical protein NRY95_21880 [Xanthomonas campestris pv. phormiicola]